ncbi:AAA family ATPase [Candidatus Micrarchaeota archaeon]|nr:AAA family ATPase [Candidatus Micrarchaeota archaeon]
MRIVLTGCPGTGKSTIAKALAAELGLELVDIKKIVNKNKLADKKHEVDLVLLFKRLAFLKKKNNYLVEGHLACEIKLPNDLVIVLRTNPATLKKRLAKRKYGKQKLEENILAEVLDYCTQRVEAVYRKKPLELDTSAQSVKNSITKIKKAIKQKKKSIDVVDYTRYLTPK